MPSIRNKKKVIAAYCEMHVHVYFACMIEWLVSIILPRNMRYDKNFEFGIGKICLGYLPMSMGLDKKLFVSIQFTYFVEDLLQKICLLYTFENSNLLYRSNGENPSLSIEVLS